MFGQRNVMVLGKARRNRFPAARTASGKAAAAPPSNVRNSRRLISNMARFPPPASAGVPSRRLLAGYRRDFKPELYPQKHGQEDQDRVQRDPHYVGSPTHLSSTACSLMVNSPWRSNAMGPPPLHSHPATKRMDRSL